MTPGAGAPGFDPGAPGGENKVARMSRNKK